jgi:predicted Zn finger-like uncharacterized protein
MKIVCDSCSAKYSIADEKVAGKVFKIRCKKCSEVIVVRGDQLDQPPPDESTQVYDYGDESPDAIWHVVINGDQQGPFAPSQLGEMLTAGTIDWEVYVWREGFDNWLAARDVPDLVAAITGQPQEGGAADHAAADGGPDPFAGGADPYADQAPAGRGQHDGLFAQTADPGFGGGGGDDAFGVGGGADLFAQADAGASPFEGGGDDDVVASTPSPRVSQDQAMTGQRNENSVLFSLQNLQALATGGPASSSTPSASMASSSSGAKAGHASGEGSGLIDIRALASTTGVASTGGGGYGGSSNSDNVDDLLSIGTGSPLASGLGAPVLSPVVEERSNKTLIIAIAAVGGIVALAAAAVIIVLVTAEPEPVAVAAGNSTGTGAIAAGEGTATSGTTEAAGQTATDTTATQGSDQGTQQGDDEGGDEGASADDGSGDTTSASSRRRRRTGGTSSSSASTMDDPSPAGPTSSSSGGGGDIDDLLNAALGGMMAAPMEAAMAAGGDSSLPDTPPRDGVLSALRSVQGAVSGCGGGQHGVANTTITVAGATGRVTNANVTGQFAGTPVGTCVARAVRGARFPRFRRANFQVSFPYRI